MPVIQIATPFNIDIEFELAPFTKRLLAYCIDFILIILYLLSMLYLLFGGFKASGDAIGLVLLVLFIPTLLYTFLCELLLNGQTIGKKVMQVKVISLDGAEPALGQYLLRWFLRFYEWGFIVFFLFWGGAGTGILVLFFGGLTSVIVMAISPKNQRLGDIAAGTVVVNTKSQLTVEDTIFINISQPNYKVTFPEVMRLSDRDINTIKNVLIQAQKHKRYEMCNRVAFKVQEVLQVSSDMYAMEFLEKIMEDYNYLSTTESNIIKK
ncbi:MAG TPA: RDD family protein [Ferruginibacter sp.]|nr:RDD family protein [Ferruginibacter sp.]HMP21358.1 RDD family protein [Ferruginibacter sp.]